MSDLVQLMPNLEIKKLKNPSIGRQLMSNLIERVSRRSNLMVEMDGNYIKKIRIKLASNYFDTREKNLSIWVKPFIKHNKLYFNWDGVVFSASSVFGVGINRIRL